MKGKSYQNISVASSDESPKEISKETLDEETPTLEPQGSEDAIQETTHAPVEPHLTVSEEPTVERPHSSSEISSEAHAEGEDGWQSVQRPRSANSYGRRLKQRRATIGKVYTYQKKHTDTDVEYPPEKNNLQNSSRYYVVKKRTISHGSYLDQQNTNTSQVTKFGRRIVKTVAYRVKSMPSSSKTTTPENSRSVGLVFSSPLESGQSSTVNDISSLKNPIVSIGKSPSYKEVALAPPGTIAKMQVEMPQSDIRDNTKHDVGKYEEETNEGKGNTDTIISGVENILLDKNENSTDHLKEETKVVIKEEETPSTNATEENPSVMVFGSVDGLGSSGNEIRRVIEDSVVIDGLQNSFAPEEVGVSEKHSSSSFELHVSLGPNLPGVEDLKDKAMVVNLGDSRTLTNKKLSASAAPFSPSAVIARPTPVSMNITLPVGPGGVPAIAPWPINMNLHPGPGAVLPAVNPMCSSAHHAYPSPPSTPNMIHPLPFMYPPYTQPQPVPNSTFPVTSSTFHPSHFTWMNPSVPEFVAGPVWPGCHPVEFSIPAPVVEPIGDPVTELKVQHDDSAPILPVDIENVAEVKREANLQVSETIGHANEVAGVRLEGVKENGPSNLGGAENALKNKSSVKAGRSDENTDSEKTFSILIRGRRNRKQTLRMPISLLSRPHGSQSFKVIYNRVVRGSDIPKTTNFSPSEDCTASAT